MKATNLCETCAKHFAWCKSNPTFASAADDSVVACLSYERRPGIYWKCDFCDYSGNGMNEQFCGHCRRHK